MRLLSAGVLATVISVTTGSAAAQSPADPFRVFPIHSTGPIAVDAVGSASQVLVFGKPRVGHICVNFHNIDPVTITRVRMKFAYYDATGVRVGDDILLRKGKFAKDVPDRGFDVENRLNTFIGNCLAMHYPKEGVSLCILYVDRVEFIDGRVWDVDQTQMRDEIATTLRSQR
jgi:hypothetical protein